MVHTEPELPAILGDRPSFALEKFTNNKKVNQIRFKDWRRNQNEENGTDFLEARSQNGKEKSEISRMMKK